MIYLDSSALLKLLFEEPESESLAAWIQERSAEPLVSSELASVEVLRACRRINPAALTPARALLAGLDLIPLTGDVLDAASDGGPDTLRSLDALHLASALAIGPGLAAFVAYDARLLEAAVSAGLPCVRP